MRLEFLKKSRNRFAESLEWEESSEKYEEEFGVVRTRVHIPGKAGEEREAPTWSWSATERGV